MVTILTPHPTKSFRFLAGLGRRRKSLFWSIGRCRGATPKQSRRGVSRSSSVLSDFSLLYQGNECIIGIAFLGAVKQGGACGGSAVFDFRVLSDFCLQWARWRLDLRRPWRKSAVSRLPLSLPGARRTKSPRKYNWFGSDALIYGTFPSVASSTCFRRFDCVHGP